MADNLTVKEFAEAHKVGRSTVSLWCRNGEIEGAFKEDTPFGEVWFIPKTSSDNFRKPERGRPKKIKAGKTQKKQ